MARMLPRCRHSAVAVSLVAGAAAFAAAASGATLANYPDFSSVDGLQLNGDAAQVGNVLRVTDDGFGQTGTAFTTAKVVKPDRSWTSRFTLEIHNSPGFPADGVAFVVHSKGSTVVGDSGGGLGYGGLGKSLAVEFDTFDNGGDEDANEVAVAVNGAAGNPLDRADPGFPLYGAPEINAWVKYSAARKRTKVWVDDTDTKPDSPLLSAKKNLNRVFEGRARAGFTAATGGGSAFHDVLGWKLTQ